MTDEPSLRAAVLAHPDDDTPRLVYADWCDDAGDADRAAFIRAQVAAARAEPWGPAWREADALAALHADRCRGWSDVLPPYRDALPQFARGFVETAVLDLHGFPAALAAACAAEPVRRIEVTSHLFTDDDETAAALACPELARVTAVSFSGNTLHNSLAFEAVAAAETLAGLAGLSLRQRPVPPDWLTEFLRGPCLPALAALDLTHVPNLGPALANGLQDAPHRRLRRLNVLGVRLLSGELQRVLTSPALREVEELDVGWAYSYQGDGPLSMLDPGWVLPWARLRSLDVSGQLLGPDGVRELVRRPEAARLRRLVLARNQIGDAGALRLLESPHLHLYHLDVTGNAVSPSLVEALRGRFPEAVVVG